MNMVKVMLKIIVNKVIIKCINIIVIKCINIIVMIVLNKYNSNNDGIEYNSNKVY